MCAHERRDGLDRVYQSAVVGVTWVDSPLAKVVVSIKRSPSRHEVAGLRLMFTDLAGLHCRPNLSRSFGFECRPWNTTEEPISHMLGNVLEIRRIVIRYLKDCLLDLSFRIPSPGRRAD